ncbi:hypothetical protein [Enterococcus sp. BWR-S5]|uniref:hypothetical protein n=1 Tax=Enterococcus sp. BWR-S5 TaxID=2787714 RepID=UPI001923F13F|nr:hypothetical protein [Enterococcus sp. BWR-S5]MBL1227251.1 hypothetical protein [Enterococcus sp. BWR-S5]
MMIEQIWTKSDQETLEIMEQQITSRKHYDSAERRLLQKNLKSVLQQRKHLILAEQKEEMEKLAEEITLHIYNFKRRDWTYDDDKADILYFIENNLGNSNGVEFAKNLQDMIINIF